MKDDFLTAALALFVVAAAIALGGLIGAMIDDGPKPRPAISNRSSWEQVRANFAGKPYTTGHDGGYSCASWTKGKNGHGWIVLRCSK